MTLNTDFMKSIVVFNNKGGVGKTTLLCNLASYFEIEENKRVLIVDADPQCNATIYLFPFEEIEQYYSDKKITTIYDVIHPLKKGLGYINKENIKIRHSTGFNVDVLIGDTKLAILEDFLSTDWIDGKNGGPRGLKTTFVFSDLLNKLADDYDFIIFDVGPSLGAINRNVLLACDYFIIPMSSDIFSLKAIDNIAESLTEWKTDLDRGLEQYWKTETEPYKIGNTNANMCLKFLGYVNQQYTAKKKEGIARPVRAYDNIIKRMPSVIDTKLAAFYNGIEANKLLLGEIPTLHSLIPLSQSANKPIFKLEGADGVVGAHFAKVSEFRCVINRISTHVLNNMQQYDRLAD